MQERPVFPKEEALAALDTLEKPLPQEGTAPAEVMEQLHTIGAPATTAQTGGRYFGFVNGGLLPVAHAAQWLADTWNQNGALYLMSPTAARLEDLCERWVVQLLGLPEGTAMGLVTGSANALLCALAAARNELLRRQGYDAAESGLRNAPAILVVLGEGAHATVRSALSLLGIGAAEVETVPMDALGRMDARYLPELDGRTLLILQAGNVNGGGFDPIRDLCEKARAAGAWVHIDGAFVLWAAASRKYRHLTDGLELADSWSLDAHKTLNAGYDCGIVLCREREALTRALQASGAYVQYSEQRDGMLYTTEMSRRARGIVLWAVLKSLGAGGVERLVDSLCAHAWYFALKLQKVGFELAAPVCFNQFMVRRHTPEETRLALDAVQKSGVCWCGGSTWEGEPVIRISVCSFRTTYEDIDQSVDAFARTLADISAQRR